MKLAGILLIFLLISQVFGQAFPNGPVKALYVDDGINWSDPSVTYKQIVDAGYNLIILAFLVSGSQYDAAAGWDQLSASVQQSTIAYAHSKGARIIVSTGGSTDAPYGSFSGTTYGTTAANWAKAHYLDGLDFDLENFGSGFTAAGLSTAATVQWVVDATNAARNVLGSSAIITHAPQPPYFGENNGFGDGYTKIYKGASSINFLLVQYYNNGPASTYANIFSSAGGGAVNELVSYGIPASKIVVGKPVLSGDAGGGYVSGATLSSIFKQAQSQTGWNTGVMGWQWHDSNTNSQWIKSIYA